MKYNFLTLKWLLTMSLAVAFFTSCEKDNDDKDAVSITTDQGVVINGVKWATRNLDAGGKFVENQEDYGAYFQWGRPAVAGCGKERNRMEYNYYRK